jgi:5-formyltetrahydrofolate cyclo-ligase
MSSSSLYESHKTIIRKKVWSKLRHVALPDSRFHHEYCSFIADFAGSSTATGILTSLRAYENAEIIFVAPDNCIQELRHRALKDGKTVLVTTYGIRRGFWILDPRVIREEKWEMASLLDGMERVARHVTLEEIRGLPKKIHLMVTGAGAINYKGLRFGKGHGFFDLEWAMLYSIGAVDINTSTAAVVHECQVLDEELRGEQWDTGCDFIITNQRVIEVDGADKPTCGILWDKLEDKMWDNIEPLKELKDMKHVRE